MEFSYKKAPPSMALEIKNGLKKDPGEYNQSQLKKECVLKLPNKIIYYGFCESVIEGYDWMRSSKEFEIF